MRKRIFPCIKRYHEGSSLKDPEHYYFTFLQLYIPRRDEIDLKNGCTSYEEKFKHVDTEILPNISNHDCFYWVYDDEDLKNITYGSVDEDYKEDSDSEYNMLHFALLDLDMLVQDNVDSSIGPALATVEDVSISCEEFYTFCSQLNEDQQQFFQFQYETRLTCYVKWKMLYERNNFSNLDPSYIFLTGRSGVRIWLIIGNDIEK